MDSTKPLCMPMCHSLSMGSQCFGACMSGEGGTEQRCIHRVRAGALLPHMLDSIATNTALCCLPNHVLSQGPHT